MRNTAWDNVYKMSTTARLLRYIFRNTPASRTGISEALDISPAMVTTITNTLILQGLVDDLGAAKQGQSGAAGRKRILIGFNTSARLSMGVELTKNNCHFCITNLGGKVLETNSIALEEASHYTINQIIADGINQLIDSGGYDKSMLVGVGIALPGHYDEHRHQFISHSGRWQEFDPDQIAQATSLPITCENNVRAMAYEKYMFDIEDCPENFVLIHVGAGIVCSQFSCGVLVAGDSVISGEIGHTIANPDGQRCECGKGGCLQTYASESWIIKKAQLIYAASSQTLLRSMVADPQELTLEIVLNAYDLGDVLVMNAINDAVKYLGVSISNIAIIMSPQKLYLHGRILQNNTVRKELENFVASQLQFIDKSATSEISVLDFSSARAVIGAAAIAVDRRLIQNMA